MKETDRLLPTTTASDDSTSLLPKTTYELIQQGGVTLPGGGGSVARDHLANERTFLAWIRTSLAVTGVGIGLLKITSISYLAGYGVISLGVLILVNATWRYFHVMRRLVEGKFQPNVVSITFMVVMILVLVVLFVYLSMTGHLMRN